MGEIHWNYEFVHVLQNNDKNNFTLYEYSCIHRNYDFVHVLQNNDKNNFTLYEYSCIYLSLIQIQMASL